MRRSLLGSPGAALTAGGLLGAALTASGLLGAALTVAGLLGAGACGGPVEPKLGHARLADADGTIADPGGPLIHVPAEPNDPAPAPGVVRIAVDRDALLSDVAAAAQKVNAAGGRPVFLVAHRDTIAALPPADRAAPASIKLVAHDDGKACIWPPQPVTDQLTEANCVYHQGFKHVDRAFVRELVRKARKEYALDAVHVELDSTITWADAVRAIDGARTCCGEATKPTVSVDAF